eukprot:scaffold105543_cov78-Phaeocystis_antarctica.AAC.10
MRHAPKRVVGVVDAGDVHWRYIHRCCALPQHKRHDRPVVEVADDLQVGIGEIPLARSAEDAPRDAGGGAWEPLGPVARPLPAAAEPDTGGVILVERCPLGSTQGVAVVDGRGALLVVGEEAVRGGEEATHRDTHEEPAGWWLEPVHRDQGAVAQGSPGGR